MLAGDVFGLQFYQCGHLALMMPLMEALTPLNRVFCSDGYDQAIDYLRRILPFEVHAFTNADQRNGWVIPPHWDVREAKILDVQSERVVYDGLWHPLAVIALSRSFEGVVTREELCRHLHVHSGHPQAIPFHFRQLYRSWDRDWGFCVPATLLETLDQAAYRVVIKTEERDGVLKVLSHDHRGELPETFVFVAHLDHPGMANDDLAGCVVGVELMRRLREVKTRFSYRLVLVQEIIGSEYYLGHLPESERLLLQEGVFLEMLGSRSQLALQASMDGRGGLEAILERQLDERQLPYRKGAFKEIISNDEYVFEAYGIPLCSLSRFPYPEYHSDQDDVSIIDPARMEEAVSLLLATIKQLEEGRLVKKRFGGVLCLSHPTYDLYAESGQPSLDSASTSQGFRMKILMDLIPSLRQSTHTEALASRTGLPETVVRAYLERWAQKGLLELR